MSVKVCFKEVNEIVDFVSGISKVPFHVDACCGRYMVDAKSIMGMLAIGAGKEIELKIYGEDNTDGLKRIWETFAA